MLMTLTIAIVYFSVFLFAAYVLPVDNNEGWMFIESHYFINNTPYKDYFSHRLPLFQVVYGGLMSVFGETLFVMRVISAFFAAASLSILLYICKKITNNYSVLMIVFLLAWNIVFIDALSKALIYSLVGFLFSIAVLMLYIFRDSYQKSVVIFITIQMVIWLSQYPLSSQLILILVLSVLLLYKESASIKIYGASVIFVPVLLVFVYMYSNDDYRILYNTYIYNMNQIPLMLDYGIISENYVGFLDRLLFQRKNEIKQFLPILLVLLLLSVYYLLNIGSLVSRVKLSWKYQAVLYSLIFFMGYYGAFVVVGYDYPITKTYLIFPGMILTAAGMSKFYEGISANKQAVLSVILAFTILMWPYIQGLAIFKSYNPHTDIDNLTDVLKDHYTGGEIFTLFPLVSQAGIKIDRRLSMELFSLLHNLDDAHSKYYHLSTIDSISKKFREKSYSLVMISNRFRNTNKHMSRILIEHKDSLAQDLNNNYLLIDTYKSNNPFLGDVEIFIPKL